MKRTLKYLPLTVLSCLAAFLVYYATILNTDGPANIKFIEPEEEYASFFDLLKNSELKNKVIYVDFWHTGCRPCLIEFQSLPKLKSYFKKDSDIVFLYLGKDRSVPGERFRWKKMVLDKNITGYHYFITNEQFHRFWDETVKNTTINKRFPHHLIIDRQGKIVLDNAPGPQNAELITLLQEVL